jgi:hypothetical protein
MIMFIFILHSESIFEFPKIRYFFYPLGKQLLITEMILLFIGRCWLIKWLTDNFSLLIHLLILNVFTSSKYFLSKVVVCLFTILFFFLVYEVLVIIVYWVIIVYYCYARWYRNKYSLVLILVYLRKNSVLKTLVWNRIFFLKFHSKLVLRIWDFLVI